jgi:adenylosuccinate synthase
MTINWPEIIPTIASEIVLLAAAAWLIKALVSNRMVLDVEKFKTELRANSDAEIARVTSSLTRAQATQLVDESSRSLQQLHHIQQKMTRTNAEQQKIYSALGEKVAGFLNQVAQVTAPGSLMSATQQMQEAQMSFNLQYLMLQGNMQNENSEYTSLSNVMKSRFEALKGMLSNLQ